MDKSLEHLLGHQSKLVPFTFACVQFTPSSSKTACLLLEEEPNQRHSNALGHSFPSHKEQGGRASGLPRPSVLGRLFTGAERGHANIKSSPWHKTQATGRAAARSGSRSMAHRRRRSAARLYKDPCHKTRSAFVILAFKVGLAEAARIIVSFF